jgi:undecaprenyl-diphosphatase
MNILQSIILGIVEGLTEFLPISSTFHLIMTSRILGLPSTDFLKMFEVVIQGAAIGAILLIYAGTLLKDWKLLRNILLSFIPTAIIGYLLQKIIKTVFFEDTWLMMGAFVGVGLLFLFIEFLVKQGKLTLIKSHNDITPFQAIIIGLAQACSVIPGVSRAGSIIVIMLILGYKRDESAKYTFMLSLPTIFAASALDLYQGRGFLVANSTNIMLLTIGSLVSLLVAYFVVKWLIKYLATHTLAIFGWYRLVLATILILFKALP